MRWVAKRDPCVPVAPPPHTEDRGEQEGDGGWGQCCPWALTLVIERVGQLVPHHHADAAKIKGSVGPWETEPGECSGMTLSQPTPGPGPPPSAAWTLCLCPRLLARLLQLAPSWNTGGLWAAGCKA